LPQAAAINGITLNDEKTGTTRAFPPLCVDFGSMPITRLAVRIWAFCASISRAGGDRWLHGGLEGLSGQSR